MIFSNISQRKLRESQVAARCRALTVTVGGRHVTWPVSHRSADAQLALIWSPLSARWNMRCAFWSFESCDSFIKMACTKITVDPGCFVDKQLHPFIVGFLWMFLVVLKERRCCQYSLTSKLRARALVFLPVLKSPHNTKSSFQVSPLRFFFSFVCMCLCVFQTQPECCQLRHNFRQLYLDCIVKFGFEVVKKAKHLPNFMKDFMAFSTLQTKCFRW